MAPASKNRSKNGKTLQCLFVVICGLQLVVVWHWFRKALPQDAQLIISPISMNSHDIRGRRGSFVRQNEASEGDEPSPKNVANNNKTLNEQQVVIPLAQHNENTSQSSISNTKLWHRSSTLPLWIQEYFDWAVEQQQNLTEANWQSQNYVVMQCLTSDAHCGGTSDRLKPIPLVILMAMRSKRLFYIRWTRPCPLEEFLLPPDHGYNWTMPAWLVPHMDDKSVRSFAKANNRGFIEDAKKTSLKVLRARLQTFDGGSIYFNEELNHTGVSYESIYHDLFRILFQPSPPLQAIIDAELKSVGLTPNEYATAHYRAFYGKRMPDEAKIRSTAINAVECASELRPGGPIYFASDSMYAIESIQNYAREHNRSVVTSQNDEPLHLDKANSTNAADYYSVFVDLFLLGMGNCGSVGMGGFGRYGLLLSYNASCWNRHSYNRQSMDCHWKDAVVDDSAAIQ